MLEILVQFVLKFVQNFGRENITTPLNNYPGPATSLTAAAATCPHPRIPSPRGSRPT